jgi:hypothetical protein
MENNLVIKFKSGFEARKIIKSILVRQYHIFYRLTSGIQQQRAEPGG